MKQYSEYQLQRALAEIDNGQSIRYAAREWGVPEATLRLRRKGAQSRDVAWA
ncbi:hypothetical protein LX36DRAFT_427837, partial [Colletotrichum falcatum]